MKNDVLIVGAGISGLMIAEAVERNGLSATLLDKGRSVGGRLATRRIGGGKADHGAQFFTVRTTEFREYVDEWLAEDLVFQWSLGWSDGSLKRTASDGHPRYVARQGMNSIAHHLESRLNSDIRTNTRAIHISYNEEAGLWEVETNDENIFSARALALTAPVPQTLELVDHSQLMLSEDDRAALDRIHYGPCLCGMHVVKGTINLPDPGAVQNFQEPVYWIADNKSKGLSDEYSILTTHAEARYSRVHFDDNEADVLAFLRESFRKYLSDDAEVIEEQLKRWRYSVPLTTHPRDYMIADGLPPLLFAGDAFGGRGRIEGAFLSGRRGGQALADHIKA